ncbi:MAG TPA: thioredoxin domain-containing protein [Candidatus Binatia bacterium]
MLRSFPRTRSLLLVCTLALVAGCSGDSSDEIEALRRELAELRSAQEALVQRLADLEKRQATQPPAARQAPRRKLATAPAQDAAKAAPQGAAQAAAQDTKQDDAADIPIGASPTLGNENAPVTVVEFADFQCPYCKSVAAFPKELVAAFPDQVRFVFKHYPLGFHADAWGAATAAWAAHQQGKFWEMYELIYAGDTTTIPEETLRSYAEQLGLDMERFDRDRAAPQASRSVAWDKKIARKNKVGGTPTYFVNGRRVIGPDTAKLRALVEEELAKQRQPAAG